VQIAVQQVSRTRCQAKFAMSKNGKT